MWQSILIVLALMLICGVLFAPFYLLRKKETVQKNGERTNESPVSLKKAIFLVLAEGVLFIGCLAYFVLKSEGVISSSLGWVAAVMGVGVVVLHFKNKRIKVRIVKTGSGILGRSLVALVSKKG